MPVSTHQANLSAKSVGAQFERRNVELGRELPQFCRGSHAEILPIASFKEALNGGLEGFPGSLRRCLLETLTLICPVRLSSKLTVTLDTVR